jgi:hypothetical protein
MAFVNEELTSEQKKAFAMRGISARGSNIAHPVHQTIDHERGMCLTHLCVWGHTDSDSWNTHYFLFEWNGEEHIIIMKYTNPAKDDVAWYISEYENVFTGKEYFAQDFSDALVTYAVSGRPNQQGLTSVTVEMKKG